MKLEILCLYVLIIVAGSSFRGGGTTRGSSVFVFVGVLFCFLIVFGYKELTGMISLDGKDYFQLAFMTKFLLLCLIMRSLPNSNFREESWLLFRTYNLL